MCQGPHTVGTCGQKLSGYLCFVVPRAMGQHMPIICGHWWATNAGAGGGLCPCARTHILWATVHTSWQGMGGLWHQRPWTTHAPHFVGNCVPKYMFSNGVLCPCAKAHILWVLVCRSCQVIGVCGPNGNGPAHAHYLWALVGHSCNAWWWAVPKCQGTHTVGNLWAQVARLWVVCGPRVCPLHLNYGVCPVCGMTLCLALGLNTCQLQTQTSQPPKPK